MRCLTISFLERGCVSTSESAGLIFRLLLIRNICRGAISLRWDPNSSPTRARQVLSLVERGVARGLRREDGVGHVVVAGRIIEDRCIDRHRRHGAGKVIWRAAKQSVGHVRNHPYVLVSVAADLPAFAPEGNTFCSAHYGQGIGRVGLHVVDRRCATRGVADGIATSRHRRARRRCRQCVRLGDVPNAPFPSSACEATAHREPIC